MRSSPARSTRKRSRCRPTTSAWIDDYEKRVYVAVERSAPRIVGSESGFIGGVALADDAVYWTVPSQGLVLAATLPAGERRIFASGQERPTRIATMGSRVYWSNEGTFKAPPCWLLCINQDGAIMRLDPGGASPTTIMGAWMPGAIAVHDDWIYWYYLQTTGTPAIARFQLSNGSLEIISRDFLVQELAVEDDAVYVAARSGPSGLARIAWPSLEMVPLGPTSGRYATSIAIDAERLYWTDSNENALFSVPKSGGERELVEWRGWPSSVRWRNGFLYWGTRDGTGVGSIRRRQL